MLKQRISDPLTDAKIGLAGPVWGLGAALAAFGVYVVTRAPDLAGHRPADGVHQPVQSHSGVAAGRIAGPSRARSDGSDGSSVGTIAVVLVLTEQRLLLIVGGAAVWRALQAETGPGDSRVLATFVVLIVALSLLARGVG